MVLFYSKVAGLKALLQTVLHCMCLPVNFAEFCREAIEEI